MENHSIVIPTKDKLFNLDPLLRRTPGNILTWIILTVGLIITIIRFTQGIGSVTNLDDNQPWGLWIGFDLLCGVCLAVACFAKIIVVDMLLLKSESVTYLVAFVVCATMAVTVCLAKIVGSTLPLLAKKLGFDPAVMASPIITTIVDFLSLLVYFAFATAILGIG